MQMKTQWKRMHGCLLSVFPKPLKLSLAYHMLVHLPAPVGFNSFTWISLGEILTNTYCFEANFKMPIDFDVNIV